MSSDNQYTALGPASVGFQTDSTDIDKGVQAQGNSVGVEGSGPTGVRGSGSDVGVHGAGAFGVYGEGRPGGAGGRFTSDDDVTPQLHLHPREIPHPPASVHVQPEEFPKWHMLPKRARHGDLWIAHHDARFINSQSVTKTTSLWLCVVGGENARWRQVLLGREYPGVREPPANL
jgi:hypothetical protein